MFFSHVYIYLLKRLLPIKTITDLYSLRKADVFSSIHLFAEEIASKIEAIPDQLAERGEFLCVHFITEEIASKIKAITASKKMVFPMCTFIC